MKEADRLIYEKSNVYRLHADNLRWTLLGGYAAFITAATALAPSGNQGTPSEAIALNLTLFAISNFYLLVLAVQNWFYNLFARFVNECEERLSKGQALRPLDEFAVEEGKYVNPFHAAFFFAEFIVALASFYFLYAIFAVPLRDFLDTLQIVSFTYTQLISALIFLITVILILFLYLVLLNYFLFRRWNEIIYEKLIKRFSNLWQPLHSKTAKKKAD